jgi:hypothetical protein
VFEQGARPYGKIEDGLPRWHEKLRDKEYRKIDENLGSAQIVFVPKTEIGRDLSWRELYGDAGFSAIVLANGAWRDRGLPIEGADAYAGRGLVYQNELVYWFNHYEDAGYDGPVFEIPDDVIIVGGGLASIDVVKIVNLELYARALRARGIDVDIVGHSANARGPRRHGRGARGEGLHALLPPPQRRHAAGKRGQPDPRTIGQASSSAREDHGPGHP